MKRQSYWLQAVMFMSLGACIGVSIITLATGIAPLVGTPSPLWHGIVGIVLPAIAIAVFASKKTGMFSYTSKAL